LGFLALGAITTVYYRLGVIVVHQFEGAAGSAPYAAAARVLDAIGVIGAVFFAALGPRFSRAHRDDRHRIWSLWLAVMRRLGPPVVLGVVVLAAAAVPIARLLFGARYAHSAGENLRLLAPAGGLIVLLSATSVVVYMDDARQGLIRLTAVNLAVIAALTVGLTAIGGDTGACIAASLAELFSFVSFALLLRRRYGRREIVQAPA
jgi:O-antigen/teichoic acid export membrane protein